MFLYDKKLKSGKKKSLEDAEGHIPKKAAVLAIPKEKEPERKLVSPTPMKKEMIFSSVKDDDDDDDNGGEGYMYIPPPVVNTLMTEKHRPQKVSDIRGNAKAVSTFRDWLHKKIQHGKLIAPFVLLHGPAGIGKTTLAHAVLRERGYEVCECNASDSRTVATIVQRIREVCEQATIDLSGDAHTSKKSALVIDEVDGLYGGDQTDDSEAKFGSIHSFVRFLTTGDSKLGKMTDNAYPVVMICNNISKIKELRDVAEVIPMYPLNESDIISVISSVAQKEKVHLSMQEMREMAKSSNGDVRQSLANLSLQKLSKGGNGSKTLAMTSFQVSQRLLYEKDDTVRKSVEPLVASEYSYVEPLTFENYLSTFPAKGKKTIIDDLDEMVRMAEQFSELDTMNTFVQNHPAMDIDGSYGDRGMEPICAPILQASMAPRGSRATFDFAKQGFNNQPPRLETAKFFENRNKTKDKAAELREVETILPSLFRGLSCADMQDMSMVGQYCAPSELASFQKHLSTVVEKEVRTMHSDSFETVEETEEQIKVMTIKVVNHLVPSKKPAAAAKKWKK